MRVVACLLLLASVSCSARAPDFRTWDDVADAVEGEYALVERTGTQLSLLFEYDPAHVQSVTVSTYRSMGRSMVDFSAPVGPIDPDGPLGPGNTLALLRRNYELGLGAFALDGDTLVVRQSVVLDELRRDALELHLHAVASLADEVVRELRGEPPRPP